MRELWNSLISFLGILSLGNLVDSKLEISFGILETSVGDYFCVSYNPTLTTIPSKSDSHTFYINDLSNLTQYDTCNPEDPSLIRGKIPLISGDNDFPNCSLAMRASRLQGLGALGIISDGTIKGKFNASQYPHLKIPLIRAISEDIEELSSLKPSNTFHIYHMDLGFFFDPAIVALFIMATSTVMLGSYLSGCFMMLNIKQKRIVTGENRDSVSDQSQDLRPQRISSQEDESSVAITPLKVMIYVVFMSCFLVTIYFLSDYIIYGLIGLYILLSIVSTYSIFESIVMWTYSTFPNLPTCYLPKFMIVEFRQIVLLLLCISLVVVWFIFRKASWIWTIQDFLGIIICLLVIRDVRLPSLKICTLLLSLLFFYDIFFVFITPFFTSDGESIMVDVAKGGDSGETFPIVLIVPRMLSLKKYCFSNYMMLGLGDVAIPGLLVSYCNCFDIYMENSRKIYWIVANVGYIIGLIITDVSLFVSGVAQPALLYLVPCTLFPIFFISLIRGEFKTMWNGGRSIPSETTSSSSS